MIVPLLQRRPNSRSSATPDAVNIAPALPLPEQGNESTPYTPAVPEGAQILLAPGRAATTDTALTLCPNCGCDRVEQFCPRCGQENTDPIVPLHYLLRDAADELLKVDGRIWATLRALFFRPGQLTRDFLDGKRTAYIGPLKLYFAVSAAYFLVFTLMGMEREVQQEIAQGARAGAQIGRQAATGTPRPSAIIARDIVQQPAKKADAARTMPEEKAPTTEKQRLLERKLATAIQGIQWIIAHMSAINLALLPVYAGLLSLLYWRRRRELPFVAHLVFTLHVQSALYLMAAPFVALAGRPGTSSAGTAVSTLILGISFVYYYLALRRAYDAPAGVPASRTLAKALLWPVSHGVAVALLSALAMVVYMLVS